MTFFGISVTLFGCYTPINEWKQGNENSITVSDMLDAGRCSFQDLFQLNNSPLTVRKLWRNIVNCYILAAHFSTASHCLLSRNRLNPTCFHIFKNPSPTPLTSFFIHPLHSPFSSVPLSAVSFLPPSGSMSRSFFSLLKLSSGSILGF